MGMRQPLWMLLQVRIKEIARIFFPAFYMYLIPHSRIFPSRMNALSHFIKQRNYDNLEIPKSFQCGRAGTNHISNAYNLV